MTGIDNTATGWVALFSNTTDDLNTATGSGALFINPTGGNMVGISNIDIGNRGMAGESNTIRIGTSPDQTRTFVAGIYGVTVSGTLPRLCFH